MTTMTGHSGWQEMMSQNQPDDDDCDKLNFGKPATAFLSESDSEPVSKSPGRISHGRNLNLKGNRHVTAMMVESLSTFRFHLAIMIIMPGPSQPHDRPARASESWRPDQ